MTRDLLDDLLRSAAPATRAAEDDDLTAMIASARREAEPPRRARRRGRVAVATGALAAILMGGAGVAVATDGLSWAPWVREPLGAVQFSMAGDMDCELRFSGFTGGADAAFVGEVNRALEDWYRSTDVVGEAQPLLAQKRADIAAMAAGAPQDPGADMSGLTPAEREAEIAHRAWADEWLTWDLVVSDLEVEALRDVGIVLPDERLVRAERRAQIQCTDSDGDLYVPGIDQ